MAAASRYQDISIYGRFVKLMEKAGAALSPPRVLTLNHPLSSNSIFSTKPILGVVHSFLPVVLIGNVNSYWRDLPPELCMEIGIRLSSRLDILRFRSVCKKWRSSLPPPTRFPLCVPSPPSCTPTVDVPCYITEASIAERRRTCLSSFGESSCFSFEEVGQGGIFHTKTLYDFWLNLDILKIALIRSTKLPQLSKLSFASKAYHLRWAYPRSDSDSHVKRIRGQWHFKKNFFVRKMVIISSNACDGINPSYARASGLSVVAHMSWGTMGGRLALLRLGGSPENWEWETDFYTQYVIEIATCRGRLCVIDHQGAVLVMDYNSLHMTQIAPPSPILRAVPFRDFFESHGHLYMVYTFVRRNKYAPVGYKLNLPTQKWIEFRDLDKVITDMRPYGIRP